MGKPRFDVAAGPATTEGWGRLRLPVALLGIGALVAGLVLRFVTATPLWLDEALSVNIAALGPGEMGEALRRDGHPPLYYLLLNGWMNVFGRSDAAVRALSGIWGLALVPLVGLAAHRIGGWRVARYAVLLTALSPFAVRYATETRMYSMLSVLVVAGWLVTTDALRKPTPARLSAVAAIVCALLWTHYWSLWLLATAGLALVVHGVRARRRNDQAGLRSTGAVVGAFVVGGIGFLPWLPSMLHQAAHTGTPWARPMRPTEIVAVTIADLGGSGGSAEAIILGWTLALLGLLAVFGRAQGPARIQLELTTRPAGRPLVVLAIGTLTVACIAGYATGSTFASRYASVIFPFIIILAAMGLDLIRHRVVAFVVLSVLLALSGLGAVLAVTKDRSDAARSVAAIEERARPGDWVVYCPDQLGPSGSRLMEMDLHQVTYPAFGAPERVDWTDYQDRLDATGPEEFAAELVERTGDHAIHLVYSTAHETHRDLCPELVNILGHTHRPEILTHATEAYEPAGVVRFTPAPD